MGNITTKITPRNTRILQSMAREKGKTLSQLKNIKNMTLQLKRPFDLSALHALQLRSLTITDLKNDSLKTLNGIKIKSLTICNADFNSILHINDMPEIERFSLINTPIKNTFNLFSMITGWPHIRSINLTGSPYLDKNIGATEMLLQKYTQRTGNRIDTINGFIGDSSAFKEFTLSF